MRRRCLILGLVLVAGCAARQPRKPAAAELAALARTQATALLVEGCYDCILEARSILEPHAVGPIRPALVVSLFELQLLITMREKELAIDASASFERAQALAVELPPISRWLTRFRPMLPDSRRRGSSRSGGPARISFRK
jgi:hypothetical protein